MRGNMAAHYGLFGLHKCGNEHAESPDNSSRHATPKNCQIWAIHLSISSTTWVWLPFFTSAISRHSAVILQLSIQHETVCHLPTPQAKIFQVMCHHGKEMTCTKVDMAGLECSPPAQFPADGPSFPDTQIVPPGLLGNHPVSQVTSCSLTFSSQPSSGALGRHPIWLPTKEFQPPVELRKTHVAGLLDLPPLPEMSHPKCDATDESNPSAALGGAEGKLPISLKQSEFSLKQFTKTMGQANYSVFNKYTKV